MSQIFVKYLTINDYAGSIMGDQLNDQILACLRDKGDRERQKAEAWAVGIVRSKIRNKYDLTMEITDTLPFDPLVSYKAGQRCIIDFEEDWESGVEYVAGNLVMYSGNGYRCLTDHTSGSEFEPDMWQGLGKEDDIYYIAYPYPVFSYAVQQANGAFVAGWYLKDSNVWWADHTYRSINGSIGLSHDTKIQSRTYQNLPSPNIFPNDPVMGKSYWEDLGVYSIEAGQYPFYSTEEVPSVWTLGDNRDPLLVQCIVDLALWKLHHRIAPNNIPVLRQESFKFQMVWLQSIKVGEENSDIPPLQPNSNRSSVSWGSNVKQINGY